MSEPTRGGGGCRPRGPLPTPLDDPAVRYQLEALEDEIRGLAQEQAQCRQQARELLARELGGGGVFAQEIFRLKQRNMMLATEIQHRKARINALLLGI